MRKLLMALALAVLFAAPSAFAQTATATPSPIPECSTLAVCPVTSTPYYADCSVSVTSSTVPVLLLPNIAAMHTFTCKVETGSATGVKTFEYSGTINAQVPAGTYPIDVGGSLSDGDICGSPGHCPAGQSLGAVLPTGSTPVIVDCKFRCG